MTAWSHCQSGMVTWSHCNDMTPVTTDPLILVECDKCARVAEISGFWEQGVGEGRGKWENGSKASDKIFIIFSMNHLHIVKLDAAFPL